MDSDPNFPRGVGTISGVGVSTESISFRRDHFDELRGLAASPLQNADASAVTPSWARLLSLLPPEALQTTSVLPVLIEDHDWALIEPGLIQRAQLLQALLDDAYGAEELSRRALLPQALVRGHPAYLPSLHCGSASAGRKLRLLAFDLARDPQGRWQVLGQQTQAPQGLGQLWRQREYSLANFAPALAGLGVRGLDEASADWAAGLRSAGAQATDGDSRWVMLGGETLNEGVVDADRALQLGLIPVQGDDLQVRQARLYLKSLGGRLAVHGLLTSLPDEQLDPLELRSDCTRGVAGLLQALRAGHLTMSNPPGTGFLESPALAGFLPGISQALRGENLILPDRPSWWCGEKAALDNAWPDLSQCTVLPSYPDQRIEAIDPAQADSLETWTRRLRGDGESYTLKQRLTASLTPFWHNGQLDRGPVTLRFLAVLDAADRWVVVPGALARLTRQDTAQPVELQTEAWVLSRTAARLKPPATCAEPTLQAPVLARRAQDVFWLGRYLARAELALHGATEALKMIGSEPSPAGRVWLDSLLRWTALVPVDAPSALLDLKSLPEALLQDLQHARVNGIRFNLDAMTERVRRLHAHLPGELLKGLQAAEARLAQLPGGEGSRLAKINRPRTPGPWDHDLQQVEAGLEPLGPAILQIRAFFTGGAWHPVDAALFSVGLFIERLSLLPSLLADACACGSLSEPTTRQGLDALMGEPAPTGSDEHLWLHMRLDCDRPGSWAQGLRAMRQQLDTLEKFSVPGPCMEGPIEDLAEKLRACQASIAPPRLADLAQAMRLLAESARSAAVQMEWRYFSDRADPHSS